MESIVIEEGKIEIDPKGLKTGYCRIVATADEKLAICKSDDGKIRIYKVEEDE